MPADSIFDFKLSLKCSGPDTVLKLGVEITLSILWSGIRALRIGRLYRLTRSTTVQRSRFLFHLFSLCPAVVQAYKLLMKQKRCADLSLIHI